MGTKAYIYMNREWGLAHTYIGTTAAVNELIKAKAGNWYLALRPTKRAALDTSSAIAATIARGEEEVRVCARSKYTPGLIKWLFGTTKVR